MTGRYKIKNEGLGFPDNLMSIFGFYQRPKNPPARDAKYRAWIRTLPCAVCGRPGPSEAAHQRILQGGGIGLKPSDYEALPLCEKDHRIEHENGSLYLWNERSILKFSDKTELRAYISTICQNLLKSYQNQFSGHIKLPPLIK